MGVDLSGSDVDEADFSGASLLGADLSDLTKSDTADWTEALYDDETTFDPGFDPGDLTYIPEPDGNLGLLAGAVALAFLRRQRGA
jgi:hypothetical protein